MCNESRNISVTLRCATGWMIEGSSPGRGWDCFSSPQRPDRLWGHSASYPMGFRVFLWG